MKRILLLVTQQSIDAGQTNPAALCAALTAAANGAARYEYAVYDQLRHVIAPEAGIFLPDGTALDSFDVVYQRRWGTAPGQALSVAIFLRIRGVPCIDDEADNKGSVSKLTQYWRLWEHGLPFPQTVFVAPERLAAWLQNHLHETFSLPCIMKSTAGTRGADNYLVHTLKEALSVVAGNPGVPFLVQEFIPNDGDYRIFVCGETVALAIRRVGSGDTHKNNTSQGGRAELTDVNALPQPVRNACVRAAKVFNRTIAGVDVVFHKDNPDRYYIFEVNRAPQIEDSTFTQEKAVAVHTYMQSLTGGGA